MPFAGGVIVEWQMGEIGMAVEILKPSYHGEQCRSDKVAHYFVGISIVTGKNRIMKQPVMNVIFTWHASLIG